MFTLKPGLIEPHVPSVEEDQEAQQQNLGCKQNHHMYMGNINLRCVCVWQIPCSHGSLLYLSWNPGDNFRLDRDIALDGDVS